MEQLSSLFSATLSIFQTEVSLLGFTFSFWDVFLWSTIAGILIAFIGGFIHGS